MMNSLITQCPSCGTSFKLTSTQMEAASGAVRCGACLEVFSASEYLVGTGSDELTQENQEIDSSETCIDESATAESAYQFTEISDVSHGEESRDNCAGDEMVEEDTDQSNWQIGTNIVYHLADVVEPSGLDADSLPNLFEIDSKDPDTQVLDEATRESLHKAIGDDPDDVTETVPKRTSILKLGLLLIGNLLLIAVLAGQFLWFNRASLSKREDMRAYFLELCALSAIQVSCNLPDYVNLKKITTRRLIVHSHPRIPNVLVIDAIILNTGIYSQPFPRLELKFTDLEANTVASRRFDASEYLAGELQGMKYMPAGTEVRLDLEIIDPGERAVSYELYAVRASQHGS